MEGSSELQAKYQKLLQAYADLKAKNSVLKKAVLEQQQSTQAIQAEGPRDTVKAEAAVVAVAAQPPQDTNHVAALEKKAARMQAQLHEKDQRLRDATQELDTATFRNQQLAKRVEVLQEEVEKLSKGGAKSSSKSRKAAAAKQEAAMQLQEEELRRKIAENAQLHQALKEHQAKHRQDVENLRRQLHESDEETKGKLGELQRRLDSTTQSLQLMTEERNRATAEAHKLIERLNAEETRKAMASSEADATVRRLQDEIEKLRASMMQKVTFDDTTDASLNVWNLHMPHPSGAAALRKFFDDAAAVSASLASNWGSFLTYIEDRARALGSAHDLPSNVVEAYCNVLSTRSAFKPLGGVCQVLATCVSEGRPTEGLQAAVNILRQAADYLLQLCDVEAAYFQSESASRFCTPSLRATNSSIVASNKQLQMAFVQLVEVLAAAAERRETRASATLSSALGALERIHASFQAICSLYSSKLSLEQRLEDAPAALRGTEELINSALSKAVVAFQRLSQLLKENRGLLDGAVFAIKGAHGAPLQVLSDSASRAAPAGKDSHLHKRARSWMKRAHSLLESSPEDDAASNGVRSAALRSDDRAELLEEIASLKRELEMVKHEKEQVVLDAELLRIQVQKRRQQGSISDSPTAENDNLLSDDEISREALIKEHYMARIGQLSAQLHYTDGRAVAFFEECKALALKLQALRSNRLEQAESIKSARKERVNELRTASSRANALEEELSTVKRNYETQLATMSETLMVLNDQLQQRQEMVDMLQAQRRGGKR